MLQALVCFGAALVAGFCQSVTGFGGGILLMLVLPEFFPFRTAPTVSNTIIEPLSASILWRNRAHVQAKKILLPAAGYMCSSTIAIFALGALDLQLLKYTFGLFLVALSIYFFFISERIHIRATPLSAILCGLVAGTFGGLFGIGGPPVVLYFLAASESREEYLGSCNGVFCITMLWQLILRLLNGYVPSHFVLTVLFGLCGIFLGRHFGLKVAKHINDKLLKKVIYAFLAVSGVLQLLR